MMLEVAASGCEIPTAKASPEGDQANSVPVMLAAVVLICAPVRRFQNCIWATTGSGGFAVAACSSARYWPLGESERLPRTTLSKVKAVRSSAPVLAFQSWTRSFAPHSRVPSLFAGYERYATASLVTICCPSGVHTPWSTCLL